MPQSEFVTWSRIIERTKLSADGFFNLRCACASDDVALSSSLLLDQLEASTQHGRDIIACWLDIYNLIGQCFGHVSERNKKAAHVKYEDFLQRLVQMSHDIRENARTITDLDLISFQNEVMRTRTVLF